MPKITRKCELKECEKAQVKNIIYDDDIFIGWDYINSLLQEAYEAGRKERNGDEQT